MAHKKNNMFGKKEDFIGGKEIVFISFEKLLGRTIEAKFTDKDGFLYRLTYLDPADEMNEKVIDSTSPALANDLKASMDRYFELEGLETETECVLYAAKEEFRSRTGEDVYRWRWQLKRK